MIRPDQIHSKFKRDGVDPTAAPSVGPPRPPGVGPPRPPKAEGHPRPPTVGPPPPPKKAVEGADAGGGPAHEEEEDDDVEVGPARPPPDDDDDEDEDGAERGYGYGGRAGDDDGGDDDNPWLLPVSHEVSLVGQGGDNQPRAVTALDIDHSGSRVLSGGLDYMVRIYDFNGMKSDMRPFRWEGGEADFMY